DFIKLKNENLEEYNESVKNIQNKYLETIKKGEYTEWLLRLETDPEFDTMTTEDYKTRYNELISKMQEENEDINNANKEDLWKNMTVEEVDLIMSKVDQGILDQLKELRHVIELAEK